MFFGQGGAVSADSRLVEIKYTLWMLNKYPGNKADNNILHNGNVKSWSSSGVGEIFFNVGEN